MQFGTILSGTVLSGHAFNHFICSISCVTFSDLSERGLFIVDSLAFCL